MDDGASPTWGILIFVILILADFVVNGFVAAMQRLNDAAVERMSKNDSVKAGLLLKYQDKSERYMHVCQLLLLAVHMLFGFWEVSFWSAYFIPASAAPWAIVLARVLIFVVLMLFMLVLGIYTPEKVAARKPESWALKLVWPVHVLEVLFSPVIFLMDALANLLSRIFGVDPLSDADDVTEEEIISMVREGHEQGVLLASEAEMIHNIFEFADKEAKDIMTHRKNIAALDGNLTFREMLSFVRENHYSRFPVYLKDIDNIIGVLHIREALDLSQRPELSDTPIKDIGDLVRDADFIPETRNINTLFTMMQANKTHMVIVVDEYGQTAGLVAMEDILEEIVGNIEDEHDEEERMIEQRADGSYLMHGMADFSDVVDLLQITCEDEEEDDFETLNGFLISRIDKIPEEHEVFSVRTYGYLFEILSVENKMIQSVRVTRCEDEEAPLETEDADTGNSDETCQNQESVIE